MALSDYTDATPLQPGFMVIQGNRLEALRELLVEWTRSHPLAPLENELILVQSNGIAQWLKLAMATDDAATGRPGVAAALDVRLPGRFLWQAYRAVLGRQLPDQSPYDKEPLTWRLMRLLPDLLTDPTFAPLKQFLADDDSQRKHHQLAEQLADLLDQYQVYRSDWLAAWADGQDFLPEPGQASADWRAVPPEQSWQPALWRRLQSDIAASAADAEGMTDSDTRSRAQVHADFMTAAQHLTPETRPSALPRRIIVFGLSSLPQQTLDVLSALSNCSQVLLCVHNPCQHYWGDIIEGHRLFQRPYQRQQARPDTPAPDLADASSLHLHAHPLLAAWGRQGRDYIRLLDAHDERQQYEGLFAQQNLSVDLFQSPLDGPQPCGSLLSQLQDDILNLRPLPETQAQWPSVDPNADHSVVFHRGHGPQREVEILHDQLRAALDADPTLEPRDILVMVPDIDVYAPHVQAVFGQLERSDPRYIPYTLSDQGQRHQNPLLIALESILQGDRSRFTVSDLLDLLDVPALRARFELSEDDLTQLRPWIEGANIRWGLHQQHRSSLALGDAGETNTWWFGLRRMLLGYASDQPWQGIEPYDEVGGLSAARVGGLVRLIETLDQAWQTFSHAHSPVQWSREINQLSQALFLPQSEQDTLLLSQLADWLEQWVELCRQAELEQPLNVSVVREALLNRLDTPGLTQRFMGGAVNFATLMPMRAIPFRRICLLGMNDGEYPRPVQRPDFDLMQPGPQGHFMRPGDRSRREDDRYLFLEALLSAREQLYISWVGRHIRDNSERPPSVLVGQLRDHLARGWRLTDGQGDRATEISLPEALTTTHPLQPFSLDYFVPGTNPNLFTYAQDWRQAHATLPDDTDTDPADTALPWWLPDTPATLAQLADLLRYPAHGFFQRRLEARFDIPETQVPDTELFQLDGLTTWSRQQHLLQTLAQRIEQGIKHDQVAFDPDQLHSVLTQTLKRMQRAGDLPLPPFDELVTDHLLSPLHEPLNTFQQVLRSWPTLLPAEEVLLTTQHTPDAVETATVTLEDWLSDVRVNAAGERLRLNLLASNLHQGNSYKWHHLVKAWPAHLAAQQGGPTTTRLLGPETDLALAPLPWADAEPLLLTLLDAWADSLQRPLPLACQTGFQELVPKGKPQTTYDGGYQTTGEITQSVPLQRCWPDYQALSAEPDYATLIDTLYRPLFQHLTPDAADSGDPTSERQGGNT